MNRRRFLGLLAGAGAASATSYFFAPIGGWKSDVIVHTHWSQCPPRCMDHLHKWQVEKAVEDFRRKVMGIPIFYADGIASYLLIPPPGYTPQHSRL